MLTSPVADSNLPGLGAPHRLRRRLAAPTDPPPFINLCGDYRWLRAGYWALVDAELNNVTSRPSPVEAVTAQNATAALWVAGQRGIPCVSWSVARSAQDVPVPGLLVPVAGLTGASYVVRTGRSLRTQWRRATQNGTRPALAVRLDGRLRSLKAIMGLTTSDHYTLAWQVWQMFGLPLATVWFLEPDPTSDPPQALFLGLDPLPLTDLTQRDLALLEEVSQRPMSPS